MVMAICMIFLCAGCDNRTGQQENHINVADALSSMQAIDVSDIAGQAAYVPLETTDHSLIGNKPYIRKFGNTLLVASEKQPIMMFDAVTGKFLRTIGGIGQGKGEYILQYDRPVFWTDDNEEHIFVKTAGERMLEYDAAGNYMRTVGLPDEIKNLSALSQIAKGKEMYFYRNYLFDEKEFDIIRVNYEKGKTKSTISGRQEAVEPEFTGDLILLPGFGKIPVSPGCLLYRMEDLFMAFDYRENPCLWNFNGDVYFKKRFNDTVYQVKERSLAPRYIFELGDRRIPYEDRFRTEGMKEKISIEYVLESKKALFFMFKTNHFHFEPKVHWGVFDKETHEVKVTDTPQLNDATKGYVVEELHTATPDGTIVGMVSVEKYKELSGDASIKEDDNPIAVILR